MGDKDGQEGTVEINGAFQPFARPAICSRCRIWGEAHTRCPNCVGGAVLLQGSMELRPVERVVGQYDEQTVSGAESDQDDKLTPLKVENTEGLSVQTNLSVQMSTETKEQQPEVTSEVKLAAVTGKKEAVKSAVMTAVMPVVDSAEGTADSAEPDVPTEPQSEGHQVEEMVAPPLPANVKSISLETFNAIDTNLTNMTIAQQLYASVDNLLPLDAPTASAPAACCVMPLVGVIKCGEDETILDLSMLKHSVCHLFGNSYPVRLRARPKRPHASAHALPPPSLRALRRRTSWAACRASTATRCCWLSRSSARRATVRAAAPSARTASPCSTSRRWTTRRLPCRQHPRPYATPPSHASAPNTHTHPSSRPPRSCHRSS